MHLDDLAVFAAVGETSGISAAAKRLGLPKSTVSRALSRLERRLGVELVQRTTRRVALSSAGVALHAQVAPLLASLERSLRALPELESQPSGRLRVTMAGDFAATVAADALARFCVRYPRIQLDVHLSGAFVDIVAEGFDVAVRISRGRLQDSSLIALPLGGLAMHLFASPRYLARSEAPRVPEDLSRHDWIAQPGQRRIELTTPRAPDPVTVALPPPRIVGDDMFFARASARAGAGIALLPAFLADADVARGDLVRVLPRYSVARGRVWLVHPSARKLPPKLLAFRRFMTDALKPRLLR